MFSELFSVPTYEYKNMLMKVLLVVLFMAKSEGARILCIIPTPFYSHQNVFQPIWKELSHRGHHVTLITTNPIKNATLHNFHQIDLSFTYKLVFEEHKMQEVINTESNILILMKHVIMVMQNMTSEQLKYDQIQTLIKSEETFDLMIVESHAPAWFGFAQKFKCPIIAVSSMVTSNYLDRIIGNTNNPVFTPHMNLPFFNDLNIFQRVISALFELVDEFQTSKIIYPMQQQLIRVALDDQSLNLENIMKNISLFFNNVIPGFSKISPTVPSMVQLNGLQITPPQDLSEELQQFLDGAVDGAIYFSLGSSLKSHLMSEEKRNIVLEAFGELPFRILWILDGVIESLPENVKVVKWAPQQDVLRHRNVKLFITQGGIQSLEEAIRFEVPILGIPFFGDQFQNIKRVEELKLGKGLDFNRLTKASFTHLILETMNNTMFVENLREISELATGHPLKSLDKAIWWIEYVIRHKGAPKLRSPLADIPFYKYYLFDVTILFILIILTLILLISKIRGLLCNFRRVPIIINKHKKFN